MDGDGGRRGAQPVVVEGAAAAAGASRRSLQVAPIPNPRSHPSREFLLGFCSDQTPRKKTESNRRWKRKNRSRFVLNVPKEDLESFERILFLLEQAHWFYEDNSVEHNPSLKSLSFKDFTTLSKLPPNSTLDSSVALPPLV